MGDTKPMSELLVSQPFRDGEGFDTVFDEGAFDENNS